MFVQKPEPAKKKQISQRILIIPEPRGEKIEGEKIEGKKE
jgi:hypothetical protein